MYLQQPLVQWWGSLQWQATQCFEVVEKLSPEIRTSDLWVIRKQTFETLKFQAGIGHTALVTHECQHIGGITHEWRDWRYACVCVITTRFSELPEKKSAKEKRESAKWIWIRHETEASWSVNWHRGHGRTAPYETEDDERTGGTRHFAICVQTSISSSIFLTAVVNASNIKANTLTNPVYLTDDERATTGWVFSTFFRHTHTWGQPFTKLSTVKTHNTWNRHRSAITDDHLRFYTIFYRSKVSKLHRSSADMVWFTRTRWIAVHVRPIKTYNTIGAIRCQPGAFIKPSESCLCVFVTGMSVVVLGNFAAKPGNRSKKNKNNKKKTASGFSPLFCWAIVSAAWNHEIRCKKPTSFRVEIDRFKVTQLVRRKVIV